MTFRFDYRRYTLPFRAPVRTAYGLWSEREGLLLRLENELGVVGYGEVAPIPWFGTETVDEAEAVCVKMGSFATVEQLAEAPAHLGCLQFALKDALGAINPTEGTALAPFVPVAALLPAGRAALAQVEPKAELGFRTFKWKVGVDEAANEWGILDDLIGNLPSGSKLRLDANGAWDRKRAEQWLIRCADRPIEFVEQPIARDAKNAIDVLLGLASDYPTPIGLDESLIRDAEVVRWLDLGWPGVFVLKPVFLADPAVTLARLRKANAAVVFSSALETAVGAKAALRLAFSFGGEARALGFGTWPLFADSRFEGSTASPFLRREDVERLDPAAVWTALN